MMLLLVHVLHAVRLKIIHSFAALQLLLLILKLLEIASVLLLHLLLIALYHNVWSISSNENFSRHARVQLASIFLYFLCIMASLIIREHLRLANATIILHISSSDLCTLDLTDHCVRQAIRPNTQHPISSISHCNSSIATILLPQG